jgi:4-amino-4-deoxy-L-arabinose transferase-like glycosyltransferase
MALWPYALLLAVGMAVLLPQLGSFGLWDPWEPKYAQASREMIERGSYVVPYYRESVRLTKPILVYWGVIAGYAVFGVNEFGARIGGVTLALLTMCGVFYTVRQLRGRQAALISALVLCTVPQFYLIARQAMPDVYLFTSVGMCLMFFAAGLFGPPERRNLHLGISYACIALAVLAKGPMIIGAIFLTTLAVWAVIHVDVRELIQPGRRKETLLVGGSVLPAAGLLGWLATTAYLFGTSPAWWGYSDGSRQDALVMRQQIQDAFLRFRLAELLLVLIALLALGAAFRIFRRGRAEGKLPASAALPLLVAVAALVALGTETGYRIFVASILGSATCIFLILVAIRRFLLQPWIWPAVEPIAKEAGRQLLRFAVIFLVVAGPWQIAIFIEKGHGYVTDFLIKHNVNRAGEVVNRTGVSEFYLRVLIFGYYPWSCFLPVAVAGLVGWWDRNVLKRYAFEAFLLIATVVSFTAFTGSATKFAHYLTPILVPVAVMIGLAISRSLDERETPASRLTWIVATMLFLLPTLDLIQDDGMKYLVGSFTMKRWIPESLEAGPYNSAVMAAAAVFLGLSILWRSRILVAGLIVSAILLANYHAAQFIPALSPHKTMKSLGETWAKADAEAEVPICIFGKIKHGTFFYTNNRIQHMRSREDFERFMNPTTRAMCVIERETLQNLKRNYRTQNEGRELFVADNSHFSFVLVSTFELAEPPQMER